MNKIVFSYCSFAHYISLKMRFKYQEEGIGRQDKSVEMLKLPHQCPNFLCIMGKKKQIWNKQRDKLLESFALGPEE